MPRPATEPRTARAEADSAPCAPAWRAWMAGGLLVLGGALCASAEGQEDVTVSHGYTNFGDLKYPADMAHLDYVNPDAPKGGEISQWSQGSFDSFNRYTREGVVAALTGLMYESLLVSTADDPYGLYCYLCETLEYPDSRDWVIFNLRDDVTFSDGRPMTAEDVAFTFNLFMEQGIAEYRTVVEGFVEQVEVLDDHRIKFTFTEDAPRRDVIGFAGGTTVFSKSWFEETGARIDESTDTPFLGTGAYVLDSYETNERLIYARDTDHWGADHPLNVGQNNFDTIRVEYFADSATAFEAFKVGTYTFRTENSSKTWATGYDFPALDNGWMVTKELPDGSIGAAQSFVFNLDRPEWQDPRVREAVRLMFNFEWSNQTLFYGLYERVESFWQNTELQARGTPSEGELSLLRPLVDEGLLDPAILTDPAVIPPESRPERSTDRGNLRRASNLLDDAGWIVGDDGIRRKDGQTLSLTILQFSPAFDRIVNPFVENLSRLGVDAKLERVDSAQYVERRRTGDFDLVNHTLTQGFEPGIALKQWFHSSTADDSSRNLMRLRDPAIDRLIDHVIDAQTLDEMTTATHALDRALRAHGFWVPQWFKDVHTVAYYDMYDHPEDMPPFALGELSFWWYDADRAQELREDGAF
ncbi:extracellular solute-binding protein [Salibaculum halophilum]|uniref:extracellular solute-binding protein n=1 Tax=Salibaculum halophilum TaxID=1914408 RepID=UPI000A0F8300|nr:extracellular solute-binding protein [Salibaculum halophilum]